MSTRAKNLWQTTNGDSELAELLLSIRNEVADSEWFQWRSSTHHKTQKLSRLIINSFLSHWRILVLTIGQVSTASSVSERAVKTYLALISQTNRKEKSLELKKIYLDSTLSSIEQLLIVVKLSAMRRELTLTLFAFWAQIWPLARPAMQANLQSTTPQICWSTYACQDILSWW